MAATNGPAVANPPIRRVEKLEALDAHGFAARIPACLAPQFSLGSSPVGCPATRKESPLGGRGLESVAVERCVFVDALVAEDVEVKVNIFKH